MAVESGLFPLFEAQSGNIVGRTLIRHKVPVERYLELQTRFRHLFDPRRNEDAIAAIQSIADENITTYGLLG
jgi:pyruvate ferredoxin oxidoreductase beta subunit